MFHSKLLHFHIVPFQCCSFFFELSKFTPLNFDLIFRLDFWTQTNVCNSTILSFSSLMLGLILCFQVYFSDLISSLISNFQIYFQVCFMFSSLFKFIRVGMLMNRPLTMDKICMFLLEISWLTCMQNIAPKTCGKMITLFVLFKKF